MLDRAKKHLKFNNILLIIIMAIALSWTWAAITTLNRNYTLEQQLRQAKLENAILQLQNDNLRLEQAYYQTDEYLELQARTLLNRALEGEHLVILPRVSIPEDEDPDDNVRISERSNLQKWMDFLFGQNS